MNSSHLVLSQSDPAVMVVDVSKPVADVQPTMWGIFFEDINFGADGGLYAELVKNRSFEFDVPMMGWTEQNKGKFSINRESGSMLIMNGTLKASNPRFARVTINSDKGYGITNEGFRGMGIKKDVSYNFSVWASQSSGDAMKMRIELVDAAGKVLGEGAVTPSGKEWKKYEVSILANGTEPKGKLNIWFEGKGTVDLDMVSLFPSDTWKKRANGLRADLVQLLADMKPGFLRFPGGCIVEGRDLDTRYQWKKTVGQLENREQMINRWNTEFAHRPAPDYFQSFGLGFFEYFQLAEDIGAEPLPILSCGMACQFNTAEVVPMDQLDPYIQDALDLIEFANGDINTEWGKLRNSMGHPTPFSLKMIGVGNEQWGPQYIERYQAFVKALKSKYPAIKIVTSNGPFPEGELFEYADKELRGMNADIIDEHYYNKPEWFLKNSTRYDKYDRKGPKIFAGEYAAQSVATVSPDNKNNWECALAEAAFMTGLERNAEVVTMCSYAPLFAHSEGWQWTPDLIWFNNLKAYGTPNYYVQKLFSLNKGTHVLPMLMGNTPVTGQQGLYASAVLDKNSGEVVLKIVNASAEPKQSNVELRGAKQASASGKFSMIGSETLSGVNGFDQPMAISPKEGTVAMKGKKINLTLPPHSFSVIRVKVN
ncbi:MAG TPA: alpha-L-arabinofuranosidase C-terminal domain-containing protein [Chryseolinea sp.]|nr:alpha-L-arabinofuranosidase C-terminal domain-containing protein [Chryseolinea sp.]